MTAPATPVTVLIVGAGDRGTVYARCAAALPHRARIVAVAEPRAFQRKAMARAHGIAPDRVFRCWSEAASHPRLADAVVIATPDALHEAPAVAFARRGYSILLEKPMAPTAPACRRIRDAVVRGGNVFAVGHVLRYTDYTRAVKEIVASGALGDLVSVQHLEPVGYWHQAHSFVRGNWRNEAESTFMLMSKSCHDLDWIRHIVGRPCRRVSSFGSLLHFRRENRPARAADRCLDCPVARACPHDAARLYRGLLRRGVRGWPVNVMAPEATPAAVRRALREGPYGRCVYDCDNDVVDHQVVAMEFEGGPTATFTMTAFTSMTYGRTTRVFGTRGELLGDSRTIRWTDFRTGRERVVDPSRRAGRRAGTGHGGGDGGLFDAFIHAVATGDRSSILSGPDETLETHRIVFAAERARRTGRVARVG